MSENMFQHYKTAYEVLSFFQVPEPLAYSCEAKTRNQALARIRELTPPPTVTPEQRERAFESARRVTARKEAARPWFGYLDSSAVLEVVDQIIDALGYAAPKPDPDADLKLKPGEVAPDWSKLLRSGVHPTPAPTTDDLTCNGVACRDCYRLCKTGAETRLAGDASPPVVELDADDLRQLAGALDVLRSLSTNGVGSPLSAEIAFTAGGYARLGYDENDRWVLRIGGGDEMSKRAGSHFDE